MLFCNKFKNMKKPLMYYLYVIIGSGLLYTAFLILIPSSEYWIDLPVSKINSMEKLVQYNHATLMNSKVLSIDTPNLLQRLAGPGVDGWYDPIYVYYTTTLCVILLVFFKNYNLKIDGFNPKSLKGIKALMFTSFIFLAVHLIRDYWLFQLVKDITSGEYHMKMRSFTYNPELYIALIFGQLMIIYKQGLQIDQEQQLTI